MTSRTAERRDGVEHRYQQEVSWGPGVSWGRIPQGRLFRWGIPSLLLICGLTLLFYRLDQIALLESGEAKYPLAVLMMKIRDNWMVPFRRGDVWLNKPPLTMWLIHGTALLGGGIDEWTARLPSASAALGTVLLVFWWGRRLGGTLFGGIAGFVLLTSGHFLVMGRTSYPDQVFTFFFTATLLAFYAVYHGWWDEKAWWVMYAAMGLATMVKGPIGLLLPIPVMVAYLIIQKDRGALQRMRWVSGLMIYVAITFPWYYGVPLWYGVSALPGIVDMIRPYQASIRDVPWYIYGLYIVSFPLSFAPWSLFLPGLYPAWRRYAKEEKKVPDGLRFATVGWLLLFLVFSFAKKKRAYYLLPLLPASAVMVAYVCAYLMSIEEQSPKWLHRYLQGVLSTLLALAIGLMGLLALQGMGLTERLLRVMQPLAASVFLILLPVCLLLGLRRIRQHRYLPTFGVLGVGVFSFWLWAIVFYAPAWDKDWSAKVVGTSLQKMVPPGTDVWMYKHQSDSISVYFGRDIRPLTNLDPVGDPVQRKVPVYLLAHEGHIGYIFGRYPGLFRVCERFYYRKSPVSLVFLTNQRCPPPRKETPRFPTDASARAP